MKKYIFTTDKDNVSNSNIPIAEIHKKSGKGKYKKNRDLYIMKDKKNIGLEKFIENDGKTVKLPKNYCIKPVKRVYNGSERECLYINGISGSGKSKFISEYLKNYGITL